MLIDWITLRLDFSACPDWGGWTRLSTWGDRILRYNPLTGRTLWEVAAWDSVRSDSHQLALKFSGSALMVQGSPARCMGDGCTVFGVGDDSRDVQACVRAMLDHVQRVLCIHPMPMFKLWRVTRIDVTCNFALPSLAGVRVALSELRNVEGGRYRVSQQAGDTVYWSHLSRLRSGKAYAKGAHLRYLLKQDTYKGVRYTETDILLADRLLRMELSLRREFFRRNVSWWAMSWQFLFDQHSQYFARMVGSDGVEVTDMAFLKQIESVSESKGQAAAVARTWSMIHLLGWQAARESMAPRTWYRHLSVLRAAGLGDADISAGRVVSLRRRLILQPVSSWEELRRVA